MNRNDVFLDAMGLGPQWRLRKASADAEADGADGDAGDSVVAAVHAVVAHPAEAAATAAHVPQTASGDGSAQEQAPAPAVARAMPPRDEDTAWFDAADPAPAAARPAPAPQAASGSGAAPQQAPAPAAARALPSSDEDTSWFDDAPAAPSTRPALKSSPPAKAPPPSRPAANAPASPAAASDESYAWFDDVPATPIAKPVRTPAPERVDDDKAPARPVVRPAQPKQPAPQAMSDDGIPWFDDAPLPSFDGAFDDLYDEAGTDAGGTGVSDAAIARMDWAALRAAVQSCTRCTLCGERNAAVPGRGGDSAPWLVLAAAPSGDDEAQGRPLAGAPGQLLDNMLKAIQVAPDWEAYIATLVKCRPQGDRAPTADELAACRPYLERELALAGSRAIVTLGHTAGKGLLGAAARGKVLRLEQIPVVATYHPADLLRKPEDKAKAWADLCLARSAFDGRA